MLLPGKRNARMYYWFLKLNVSRDIPACCITFHIKFYFSEKRQGKSTKNLRKTCHWKLNFVIWSYSTLALRHARHIGMSTREHARHIGTWACKHARYVGTWAHKHARHVGTWARKHARHVDTWARKHARNIGTWARKAREHVWSKYTNNQIMKITGSSSIHKTIYHNGCYLLLFRRRQQESFEFSCE